MVWEADRRSRLQNFISASTNNFPAPAVELAAGSGIFNRKNDFSNYEKDNYLSVCRSGPAGRGCEDGVPEPGTMDVPAESVVLDEELSGGLVLEVGETEDVSLKVKVLP